MYVICVFRRLRLVFRGKIKELGRAGYAVCKDEGKGRGLKGKGTGKDMGKAEQGRGNGGTEVKSKGGEKPETENRREGGRETRDARRASKRGVESSRVQRS